jgi:hypothetical protein
MRCNIPKYGTLGIVAIALTHSIATASAGPCAGEIAEFQSTIPRNKNGDPAFVGTLPQSIDAQLEHQPTLVSVERAKKQAQTQILAALAQAEAFDSEGKRNECRDAIVRARLLLTP